MIAYGEELNEEQQQVVMEPGGPLLVIAGAGSGKTRTLTYRVARLLETGHSPGRILLATFTNKAARAMMGRVATLMATDVSRLWGGTFHHLGHRVLRVHARRLGYEEKFIIIDADDARQLIQSCLAELVRTEAVKLPRPDVIRDIISYARNTDSLLEEVISARYPYLHKHIETFIAVAERYNAEKKRLQLMDFDDLLINWRHLLTFHEDIRTTYAERFLHVLVDEYQDTNILQANITDLLASKHRNIMVVGDDAQSIYAFRGANYANIMRFPDRYPDCKIFKLETNYRSTPEILHMANLSIRNNERQFQKSLRAIRPRGILPALVPLRNAQMQAGFIAQRIIELHTEGYPLTEIAVLYRAHYHSMELQMEMTRRGIPFAIRSGIRFFEQAHIKDVTAYLRLLVNQHDELAWKRALGLYHRIGKQTAERVWQWLADKPSPLAAFTGEELMKKVPAGARPGLKKFQELLEALGDPEKEDLGVIIETILTCGYERHLQEAYPDAVQRLDDVRQLIAFAARFPSVEAFLQEMALFTGIGEDADEEHGLDHGRVVLSTVHQAKGLEWSVVFIPWCAEGMIPLARALADPEGTEEERRLFYVAVTRAKDQLYLCYPLVEYQRGTGYVSVRPSRFIRELTPAVMSSRWKRPYDQWCVEEE
ncbi:MAG: ATP-dependent helicase [Syntrophobacterales bacterium]|nr:ATP-dependent helicase [Syntrophobacterales bacterium]